MISVAIIDDNRMVREGMTALLNSVPELRVIAAVAGIGDPAMRGIEPHVVLLDVGLQDVDSLHGANAVRREFPQARVIVMDLIPAHEEIVEFVNAGVSGFVLKDATFEEFVATIRSVAAGEKVLPPRMTLSLFSQIANDAAGRNGNAAFACKSSPISKWSLKSGNSRTARSSRAFKSSSFAS